MVWLALNRLFCEIEIEEDIRQWGPELVGNAIYKGNPLFRNSMRVYLVPEKGDPEPR